MAEMVFPACMASINDEKNKYSRWKQQIPDTPWECHICRSVGVVWGVNVGIYDRHGVSGNHVSPSVDDASFFGYTAMFHPKPAQQHSGKVTQQLCDVFGCAMDFRGGYRSFWRVLRPIPSGSQFLRLCRVAISPNLRWRGHANQLPRTYKR